VYHQQSKKKKKKKATKITKFDLGLFAEFLTGLYAAITK